ncbi:PfkB family carbohydrate kinase [Roseibium salinum]|nr:PfkB family carbohydrate kinase [Roseibium salinum]
MGKRFLAIGECMVEFSPTPEGTYAIGFAGDTFNTAWYARRLAAPEQLEIGYFSAVGDDDISRQLIGFIEDAGITSNVKVIDDAAPGMYMIYLNNGERSFQYWRSRSAARRLADDLVDLPDLAQGDIVYFFPASPLRFLPRKAVSGCWRPCGAPRRKARKSSSTLTCAHACGRAVKRCARGR